MDHSTFIISVLCLIDDRLKEQKPLRQRGPAPIAVCSVVDPHRIEVKNA